MLQNRGKVYVSNFSNVDGEVATASRDSTAPTTTTTSTAPAPAPTATTEARPAPTTTTTTTSTYTKPPLVYVKPTTLSKPVVEAVKAPVIAPIVVLPVAQAPIFGGGGGALGGGGEKQAEDGSAVAPEHKMEIYAFSGIAFIAGAIGGYFLGKKMQKNPWLCAGVGAVGLGLSTHKVTTKFVYKTA